MHHPVFDKRTDLRDGHFLLYIIMFSIRVVLPGITAIRVDFDFSPYSLKEIICSIYTYEHRSFVPAHSTILVFRRKWNTDSENILHRTVLYFGVNKFQPAMYFGTNLITITDYLSRPVFINKL